VTSKVSRTLKSARKELNQLLEERDNVWSQIEKDSTDIGLARILSNQIKFLDDQITEVQGFCNLQLLESLESESRKLKWLTGILIVLTAVLTILTTLSVYKAFI
jgi:flagellar biosynthesis chaperone FliJ